MKLQRGIPLAQYASLQAGGPAEKLVILESAAELQETLQNTSGPLCILGYGTNVLISDKGLPGTVILNRTGNIYVEGNQVRADSGAVWDELVQKAITSNLWGLEFTSGIPGGVGAAVTGSIAAYGQRISDRLISAEILDAQTGKLTTWENAKFNFSYRRSDLQLPQNSSFVVVSALFGLSAEPTGKLEYQSALKAAADMGVEPDSLGNRRRIILEARRRAGSLLQDTAQGPWTAGSFFKNPLVNEDQINKIIEYDETGTSREELLRQNVIHGGEKTRVSAAHVLLAAGFHRGQTWGKVRLHPDHILKVENIGGATAQEIYDVVQHIMTTVQQKLNIQLEPEVRFLGEF